VKIADPRMLIKRPRGYVCDKVIYDVGLAKDIINLASMEKRGIEISVIMIAKKGEMNGIQGRYGTMSGLYQQAFA
jgi:hypothetical protein